jgi:hypothetical protein
MRKIQVQNQHWDTNFRIQKLEKIKILEIHKIKDHRRIGDRTNHYLSNYNTKTTILHKTYLNFF